MKLSFSQTPQALWQAIRLKFWPSKIRDSAQLTDFISRQSAHVAQMALYGYLQARMGTQYVRIFQDEEFAPALQHSRHLVFRNCVLDLAIYCTATIPPRGAHPSARVALAVRQTLDVLRAAETDAPAPDADWDQTLRTRLGQMNWADTADAEAIFAPSISGLVDAAPVIEGYKQLDREIVENSIRFRWIEVRRLWRNQMDPDALADVLKQHV